MLAAIRLLFYLGIRTVYLLGCDFRMQVGEANYAFPQDRSRSSVNGNDKSFEALNNRSQHLLRSFEKEDFAVFNCTPNSGLTAFSQLRYEDALEQAIRPFPKSIDTAGMYDRKQRESDKNQFAASGLTSDFRPGHSRYSAPSMPAIRTCYEKPGRHGFTAIHG